MYPRDVFVCHASLDKDARARPLERAFRHRGVSVWLDEGQLIEGDSLTQSVGWGLDRADLVLVVITPQFLTRPWPEKELNAALAREIASGRIRVIPILDAPGEDVFTRYPLLRDKLHFNWSDGVEAIADKVAARFDRRPAPWHVGFHPTEYTDVVWTRIIPDPSNHHVSHDVMILWDHYRFEIELLVETEPISLIHHKTRPNDWPVYIHVTPNAVVTVGQGPAPDLDQRNIDEGWIRLAGGPIVS